MSKASRELPPEVWIRVIHHLRRERPSPDGRNERSSLRLPELAAMMRVSKLFNNIASVILYKTVITDHLPLLIHNLDRPPAAAGIKSKADLLSLTQHLFLEYFEKSAPSYPNLLFHGGAFFNLVDLIRPVKDYAPDVEMMGYGNLKIAPEWSQMVAFCGAESDWIAQSAARLAGADQGRLIKNYKTVSTGSFLGGQRAVWRPILKWEPPDPDLITRIDDARHAITLLAVGPADVVAFCQRVEYGPLVFGLAIWNELEPKPRAGAKQHQYRVHVDDDLGMTSAVLAGDSRWYCTYKDTENFGWPAEQTRDAAGDHIHVREQYRRALAYDTERVKLMTGTGITTDIYLPKIFMNEERKRYIEACIEEGVIDAKTPQIPKHLRKERRTAASLKRDKWKLKHIEEAPPCEACGWSVEDLMVDLYTPSGTLKWNGDDVYMPIHGADGSESDEGQEDDSEVSTDWATDEEPSNEES